MMKAEPIGLYIHIPFCVKKCAYCDFASFSECDFPERDQYVDRLCREIDSYRGIDRAVDTVFFGGGTPSLLSGENMLRITEHLRSAFDILPDSEFTIEANPGTLKASELEHYISAGVNRLSMGLQSIHENELKILGRIHSFDDFLESYSTARKLGIKNVNVDLMYGIPKQTSKSFNETLSRVIALAPEHVSVYGLILEEGTALSRSLSVLQLPGEDEECEMYQMAADMLKSAGYEHYEISNYSKPGMRCIHNMKYWQCREYIGVGLSAYSYFGGRRFGNTRDPYAYIFADGKCYEYDSPVSVADEAYETVMLGLRTSDGVDINDLKDRLSRDLVGEHSALISRLIREGYANVSNGRLNLTERGFYVSNAILTELL